MALPIARRVVEQLGGRVWSSATERAIGMRSLSFCRAGAHAVKTPFVAVVDDDRCSRTYLCAFLSVRGYDTRAYARGDALLAAIREGAIARCHPARREHAWDGRPRDASMAESRAAGSAGHHAVGQGMRGNDARSGAARRRPLRRQAGRSGRARRDRARIRDQERDRQDAGSCASSTRCDSS